MPSLPAMEIGSGEPMGNEQPIHDLQDLPFEVRQYVTSYLQEELYVSAFTTLQTILTSGAVLDKSTPRTIFVPSPQVIALANTLIVYPPLTSRLPVNEHPDTANLALRYLRQLTSIPEACTRISAAFIFAGQDQTRLGRRRRKSLDDGRLVDKTGGHLTTRPATCDSLFERAENFWSVVGWAFNCSIKNPGRWDRWRAWLDLMLDMMDAELEVAMLEQNSESSGEGTKSPAEAPILLSKYLVARSSGRSEKRRIMRAIFADGARMSLGEFPEIWSNETKPPKVPDAALIDKKLDIDNDEYGDYMAADEDELNLAGPETGSRRSARGKHVQLESESESEDGTLDEINVNSTTSKDAPKNSSTHGGSASILLRQRMLAILAKHATIFPSVWGDLEDLLDVYTEFLRPLPLHFFCCFVLPSTPYMDDGNQSSLLRMLLRPLLSYDAPHFDDAVITQRDLEAHHLPFAAHQVNIADNAKVSVLLEGLMRLLWKNGHLEARPSLTKAVQTGIKARFNKATPDGRRKSKDAQGEDDSAAQVLRESAERITTLLAVLDLGR